MVDCASWIASSEVVQVELIDAMCIIEIESICIISLLVILLLLHFPRVLRYTRSSTSARRLFPPNKLQASTVQPIVLVPISTEAIQDMSDHNIALRLNTTHHIMHTPFEHS